MPEKPSPDAAEEFNFYHRPFGDFLNDPAIIELSAAGGVSFNEDEWWPIWVHCSGVARKDFRSFGSSGDPLTATERDRVVAVRNALEALVLKLDDLDISLVQRLDGFVNPNFVNALSPDYKGEPRRPLFDRSVLVQQVGALSRFLSAIRMRRKAERFSSPVIALIGTLQQMHWRAKSRLPKAQKKHANFQKLLIAVIGRMPNHARRQMPSASAAGKLISRRLKRQQASRDK